MASNTKLDSVQKDLLVDMKILAKDEGITLADNSSNVVMAYRQEGNVVRFAVSITSPDEKKFRRNVGQWHALDRFDNRESTILPVAYFENLREGCLCCETKAERKERESYQW